MKEGAMKEVPKTTAGDRISTHSYFDKTFDEIPSGCEATCALLDTVATQRKSRTINKTSSLLLTTIVMYEETARNFTIDAIQIGDAGWRRAPNGWDGKLFRPTLQVSRLGRIIVIIGGICREGDEISIDMNNVSTANARPSFTFHTDEIFVDELPRRATTRRKVA